MYRKITFTLLAAIVLSISINAQTTQRAKEYYQIFVEQIRSSGSTSQTYGTLYKCYSECKNLLAKGSNAEAKAIMKDIWPYLYNGAIYNSQKGVSSNALLFAKAYVDIPLSKEFASDTFRYDDTWPTMVYFAASGTYNSKDYRGAIPYFREYIRTGTADKRKDVYKFMAKAYSLTGDFANAISTLDEALISYPSDFNFLSMAINASIDAKDNTSLHKYVTEAIKIKPDDETLLNIQGKLYEDTGEYQKAYATYTRLQQLRPRSLEVAKHVALNAYNLGVLYHNRNLAATDTKTAARYAAMSKDYFRTAIPTFESILATEPASIKYLEGLAVIHSCMGNEREAADMNTRLAAAGGRPLSRDDIPSLLAFDDSKRQSVGRPSQNIHSPSSSHVISHPDVVPSYSSYAKEYVEARLQEWQAKDPYETVNEYRLRVNEATRDEKLKELLAAAEESYVKTWSSRIKLEDIVLKPYDAEHEVFLAESKYGELIIPVPRANNEARLFESGWNGIQLRNPEYRISNDRLVLSGLHFVTPTGKTYRYDGSKSLDYTETVVDIAFNDIDYNQYTPSSEKDVNSGTIKKNKISVGASDIDIDIPTTDKVAENTFAFIIANEDYETVGDVLMAKSDGNAFGEYCHKTFGIPETHIKYYENATYGTMLRAINLIKKLASTSQQSEDDKINIIFYYAGHGVPDESTHESYLLPTDGAVGQTEIRYPLKKLYSELGSLNAGKVLVFLDACFSGVDRKGDVLDPTARGVALASKPASPQGNMVIFSAASGDQTAYPYTEKGHGLFTYFLLKKIKETRGDITLGELHEYVTANVEKQALIVNEKNQTPNVSASIELNGKWEHMHIME